MPGRGAKSIQPVFSTACNTLIVIRVIMNYKEARCGIKLFKHILYLCSLSRKIRVAALIAFLIFVWLAGKKSKMN